MTRRQKRRLWMQRRQRQRERHKKRRAKKRLAIAAWRPAHRPRPATERWKSWLMEVTRAAAALLLGYGLGMAVPRVNGPADMLERKPTTPLHVEPDYHAATYVSAATATHPSIQDVGGYII